jgi:YesN/AraC family two-component response regulator
MKRILLIEDEPNTLYAHINTLTTEEFNVFPICSGQAGLYFAQKQRPDLIICDIVLPELSGYEILKVLRQTPTTAIIPFILLTTQFSMAEFRRGMELGADDYLVKPLTEQELFNAIAMQLKKQAALKQWYAIQSQPMSSSNSIPTNSMSTEVPPSIFPSSTNLANIFSFIEQNYHQSITLSDVAQAIGYSPAYLTDLVRRQTGQPVNRWIIHRRMVAAQHLLLNTNQTVSQIAETIGYETVGHFSRQFRKLYGLPPKEWKQQQCQNC